MIKVLNFFFSILKVILLIVSFMFTFYIIMFMFKRLSKDYMGTIDVFVPYLILFLLMAVNLIFSQKHVLNNLFYNITCCLVFGVLIICGYRAIFDEYMLSGIKMGYGINFNYYADIISPLKSMIYLLIASNVCLMISGSSFKKSDKKSS